MENRAMPRASLWAGLSLVGGLGCLPIPALAMTAVISGVVTAPPACVLNGNTDINVPFGPDLLTTNIDGVNYRKTVPVVTFCTGNPTTLRLRFQGTGTDFDSNVLVTDNLDLGIKLLKPDNSALNLNENFSFSYTGVMLNMQAVPVKRPGSVLRGGSFRGTAMLILEVQ